MARQNSGEQDSRQSGGLYHFVWRWHFYAGLFTAPFLIVLAVTGALYLFNHEIERWWYRGLMEVPPFSRVAAASAQEAAVLHAFPGAQVSRYTYPLDNHEAAEWTIKTTEGRALTVFVDPGSTAIKGTVAPGQRLMQIVRDMHASLLLAKPGQYVMELAACWGFILLVTGIFMWWPRRARMRGVLVPRLRAGSRTFWKDIHSVPSMWNAALVVFLILTGLPWSIFWGQQFAKLGTLSSITAPSPNFIRQPKLVSFTGAPAEPGSDDHVPHSGLPDLPWSVRNAPQPQAYNATRRIGIDAIMREAERRHIAAPGLRVIYPAVPFDTFVLSFVPKTAQGQHTVNIDPGTGALLRDVSWKNYSPVGKAVEFGVMTHMGEEFGLANQLVMLASCLLLILTISFGVVMWWRRRPVGRLGAPPLPEGFRPSWAIIATAIVLGIVFPLAGLSIVLVVLGDALLAVMKKPANEQPVRR